MDFWRPGTEVVETPSHSCERLPTTLCTRKIGQVDVLEQMNGAQLPILVVLGLTRQLGHELGPFGITVNSIAPGFILSNPTTERQWEAMGEEGQARLVESIAVKRLGTPADIVHGVLFFASDFASWITGQVLSIDGGR